MKNTCRLYLVTPPVINDVDGYVSAVEAALDAGDVACLQIRLKSSDGVSAPDEEILRLAEKLKPILAATSVAMLINDRPDLAKKAGADGVHIGQGDMTIRDARAMLGDDAFIGVTCHNSKHLALEAGEAGADYVAFGAFFPTQTKATSHVAKPDLLRWWTEATTVQSVAIGGITAANCTPLITSGADFLAISSAVWDHPDGPAFAVKAFNEAIQNA